MIEPEVTFSMDLANGPTTERFCYEAAAVLGMEIPFDDKAFLDWNNQDAYEIHDEICQEWTSRLFDAGYYVTWDAGDVVVYDLRPLSEDDRETFYSEMENM